MTDPRRLIQRHRYGETLSADELALVEIFREKERCRQQLIRHRRRVRRQQAFGTAPDESSPPSYRITTPAASTTNSSPEISSPEMISPTLSDAASLASLNIVQPGSVHKPSERFKVEAEAIFDDQTMTCHANMYSTHQLPSPEEQVGGLSAFDDVYEAHHSMVNPYISADDSFAQHLRNTPDSYVEIAYRDSGYGIQGMQNIQNLGYPYMALPLQDEQNLRNWADSYGLQDRAASELVSLVGTILQRHHVR